MENPRPRLRERFQYDLFIHDTPLTLALDVGDYPAAINIIKNSSSHPGILDEGSYERFPLFIVLCGYDNLHKPLIPNLQIAQLLLEHGAQPNRRGTVYHYLEHYSHSESPMELLVLIFRNLQRMHRFHEQISPVIGLDGTLKGQYADIRDHLLRMMEIFIAHGGRLSFTPSVLGMSQLVNILWTLPDVDLLRCLGKAGVDFKSVDVHGSTALHVLCQATYPKGFEPIRQNAVAYLLKNTDVQASKLTCRQHSCLWHALKNGYFDIVSLLLAADRNLDEVASPLVYLTTEPEACEPEVLVAGRLPLLLVPFIADRDAHLNPDFTRFPNSFAQEAKMLGPVSLLVDEGFFNNAKTELGISKVFNWDTTFKMHNKLLANLIGKSLLVSFLFGRSSSKLTILCARTIFNLCLHSLRTLSTTSVLKQNSTVMSATDMETDETDDQMFWSPNEAPYTWCQDVSNNRVLAPHTLHLSPQITKSIFDMDTSDVYVFLKSLNLPMSFATIFEFELYRRKLLVALAHSDSNRVNCTCLDDEMMRLEDSDSEDSSTSEGSDTEEVQEGAQVELVTVNFLR